MNFVKALVFSSLVSEKLRFPIDFGFKKLRFPMKLQP